MARSKSSRRWLNEHFNDAYVKQAQKAGYRSRAAYKLLEIQQKDHLFKAGQNIVELGAAPGGWSQVLAPLIRPKGHLIALDLLAMPPIEGVYFIQGDFQDPKILALLESRVGTLAIDCVLSDMAPNMSGIESADQARAIGLVEDALDFALRVLKPGGDFLAKVFQGEGFEGLLKLLRQNFSKVVIRKPDASRSRSSELYLLARGRRIRES